MIRYSIFITSKAFCHMGHSAIFLPFCNFNTYTLPWSLVNVPPLYQCHHIYLIIKLILHLLYVAIDAIIVLHMVLLPISIPTPWPIGHAIVPSNSAFNQPYLDAFVAARVLEGQATGGFGLGEGGIASRDA